MEQERKSPRGNKEWCGGSKTWGYSCHSYKRVLLLIMKTGAVGTCAFYGRLSRGVAVFFAFCVYRTASRSMKVDCLPLRLVYVNLNTRHPRAPFGGCRIDTDLRVLGGPTAGGLAVSADIPPTAPLLTRSAPSRVPHRTPQHPPPPPPLTRVTRYSSNVAAIPQLRLTAKKHAQLVGKTDAKLIPSTRPGTEGNPYVEVLG